MSGEIVRDALRDHFEAVCREELERLRRKLVGLSDTERESAETIIADVISALTRAPSQVLVEKPHPATLDAVVRLFALERPAASLTDAATGSIEGACHNLPRRLATHNPGPRSRAGCCLIS